MDSPAHILPASAFDFQRDLSRYWRYVRKQGELALTSQGWVYKNSFKGLLGALNVPGTLLANEEQTNGRLWFMRRVLLHMRELAGDNFASEIRVAPTSKLLSMPMAARIKWTFEVWRDGGIWNELIRLPGQNPGYDHRRESPAGVAKSRGVVLRTLAQLTLAEPRAWQSLSQLVAHLKKNEYQFLFERKRGYGFGGMYNSPYYGSNNPYGMSFNVARDEASGWDVVERAFVIHLLTGPLHWMGLVDLGYNAGEQTGENNTPLAWRLTEAGAWLTGLREAPQFVETGGRVVVQPNFNVLAMEPISDSVLIDLDHFADSLGGDRAITYEITRETLYRGQQAGWGAERVIAFLEKHQGASIPSNVKRTLEEWEQSHRKITFHRRKLTVQFADDDAEAQALLALTPFKPHSLDERFQILDAGDLDKVTASLRDAGWMPTVQPSGAAGVENSIRADDDGTLTFTQPAPSVQTLGRLAQFAETSPYRLTAASVRTAMNRGLEVEQVLALMADMHAGPLPEALEKQVRRWAGFFGNATIRQVVLLELSNHEVLANLANDEEIGRYIRAIEGSTRPLALVDAEHAGLVQRVLDERGVTFDEAL
jgi:Helicase conserved C-terminal domain